MAGPTSAGDLVNARFYVGICLSLIVLRLIMVPFND
jgi:hypothetical protein